MGQFGLAAFIYTAIILGWIWALITAKAGSHRAIYALLTYSVLLCAYALLDLFVYCPTTCPKIGLYYIANWGNLISGLVSGVAVVLRRRPNYA